MRRDRRASRGVRNHTTPLPLAIPAAVAFTFLVLPLVALLIRTPFRRIGTALVSSDVLPALRLSLLTSTAATAIAVLVGVPLAWVLARADFRGRSLVRAVVLVPLVLPPVVGGVALLLALGRRGVVGGALFRWFGVSLPFTTAAVVIAELFVAMPFLVITVESALLGLDARYDDAAATLGASRWFTFRHVTLPMLAPGVAAGAALCWARALGEFGATITFAGNYPGRTRTVPISVYLLLESDQDAAIALSLVLLVVSVVILAGLRGRWLRA
ncbi:MAG: ABC transporter permease [Actinomycetota bacterium]